MKVDFKVGFPDGHHEWHEVKGASTKKERDFVIRHKLFAALYPEEVYKIID